MTDYRRHKSSSRNERMIQLLSDDIDRRDEFPNDVKKTIEVAQNITRDVRFQVLEKYYATASFEENLFQEKLCEKYICAFHQLSRHATPQEMEKKKLLENKFLDTNEKRESYINQRAVEYGLQDSDIMWVRHLLYATTPRETHIQNSTIERN